MGGRLDGRMLGSRNEEKSGEGRGRALSRGGGEG